MDCSPPVSSVCGVLQARILECVSVPSSRGSSRPRDWTCISCISCIGRWVLYHYHHLEAPPNQLYSNIKYFLKFTRRQGNNSFPKDSLCYTLIVILPITAGRGRGKAYKKNCQLFSVDFFTGNINLTYTNMLSVQNLENLSASTECEIYKHSIFRQYLTTSANVGEY